jgi:protein-tyrosine kinase
LDRKNRKQMKSLKQRSLIAHHNSKSPIAEQYRTIRTNIQFASIDREVRTIMVTSSGPGEGKSTTAANLAVVMAQQGKRVLLVDADMRKPTVHYTFRANNTRGLTNVLTKQATLEEAAAPTEVDDLDVLASGPIPPNPAELIGSKAMDHMLETATTPYDAIIFDTPPVLAVTDAQIMANRCDGTILVVSSGKTENEAATQSKELLEKSKAKILGVVLNRKPQKKSNYHYYYG